MFALKFGFFLVSCLVLVAASPLQELDFYKPQKTGVVAVDAVLSRQVRSPQGGSVNLGYTKDQFGREASLQYNHNLYTSGNGRGSIDAYAQGSRNFDRNRNNFGGGVQGRWRF